MSKGLKALKRIRQETCPATICPDFDKEECCNIIEKELRVFEICLKRKPDLCAICYQLPTYECYLEYIKGVEDESFILEEDEYELLREMIK